MGGWIWNNRRYLWLVLIVFVVGIAAGFAEAEPLKAVLTSQLSQLQELAKQAWTRGSPVYTIAVIFWNNVKAVLMILATGIIAGIPAILGVFGNGALIGFVLAALAEQGVPLGSLLVFGILPHGIFEIPAFLLAAAFGVKLGWGWWRPQPGQTRGEAFRRVFGEAARAAGVSVVLLAVAALIEGTVTPYLLSRFVFHPQ